MKVLRSLLLLLSPVVLSAQTGPHWGVQGDYFKGSVPDIVVDQIEDLPERPEIKSEGYNTGIVRFNAKGAPSWAVEFTKSDLTLNGSLARSNGTAVVSGSGMIRGVVYTRYLNFFSTRFVSAGLATGIGVGKLEASYTRSLIVPGLPPVGLTGDSVDLWVPAFQTAAQVDIRPVRWISVSPFYGLRNATLGFGGAIRIHFTR